MVERLAKGLKLRPGEGALVAFLAGALLTTEGGYWLGGNGVDALFLARLSPAALPLAIVLKSVLAFVAIGFYSTVLARTDLRRPSPARARLLFGTAFAAFAVLVAARLILANPDTPDFFFFLLWAVAYLVPDIMGMQTWALAVSLFDSRQSKRLFPIITIGGAFGVIAGNFGSGSFAHIFGTENVLIAWAVLVAIGYLCMRGASSAQARLAPEPPPNRRRPQAAQQKRAWTIVRKSPLLSLLAVAVGLIAALYILLFVILSTQATANFTRDGVTDTAGLAGFLGLISGIATTLAFLLSFFVTRLLARWGVRNMLLVMPVVNVVGLAAVVFALPSVAFFSVVVARNAMLTLKESLNNTTFQTLYTVVPPTDRTAAQAFNAGVSTQAGLGLAGLLLVVGQYWLDLPTQTLVYVAFSLAAIYLIVAWLMRSVYSAALIETLRVGQAEVLGDADDQSALDIAQLAGAFARATPSITGTASNPSRNSNDMVVATAITGLRDRDEGVRRLAAYLLGQARSAEGVTPLRITLTTDSSTEVRAEAVNALAALRNHAPNISDAIVEALNDRAAGVRAAAAAALRRFDPAIANVMPAASPDPDPALIRLLRLNLRHNEPDVVAEAALTLTHYGRGSEAMSDLWELTRGFEPSRIVAARAIGALGDPVFGLSLTRLLNDPAPAVRQAAARAIGALAPTLREVELGFGAAYLRILARILAQRSLKPGSRASAALTYMPTFGDVSNGRPVALTVRLPERLELVVYTAEHDAFVSTLLEELADENISVRHAAAESLAELGERARIAVIARLGRTRDPVVEDGALHSLEHLATAYARAYTRSTARPIIHDYGTPSADGGSVAPTSLASPQRFVPAAHQAIVQPTTSGAAAKRPPPMISVASPGNGEELVIGYVERQMDTITRYQNYLAELRIFVPYSALAALALLTDTLEARLTGLFNRGVRAIGILNLSPANRDAFRLIANSLRRADARVRADALETLENIGDTRLTPRFLRLIERDGNVRPDPQRTLVDTLAELWLERDPWLRALVLYSIGALRMEVMRPLLEEALASSGSPLLIETGFEALQELDEGLRARGIEPPNELTAFGGGTLLDDFNFEMNLDVPGLPQPNLELMEHSADSPEHSRLRVGLDSLYGGNSVSDSANTAPGLNLTRNGPLSTLARVLFLKKVRLFANLSPEDLRRVATICEERTYSPGEVITREGDPGDELYIIVNGKVEVIGNFGGGTGGGMPRILATSNTGDALGEMAILDETPRSATLRAAPNTGSVRVLVIGADDFRTILRERPELAVEVIKVLSRWVRENNRRLQELPMSPQPLPGTVGAD